MYPVLFFLSFDHGTKLGMYNVKLDPDDFNSTQMRSFSGDLVYAQNKRQQVVMAERFAVRHPSIYFASWHPGMMRWTTRRMTICLTRVFIQAGLTHRRS